MKKSIFTICSIAAVCCAIFFACAKDDNSITHVGYTSQTSGGTTSGTGGNPNPNGNPSSSGYGTTTATTAATTTSGTTTTTPGSTLTINGTANSTMKSTGAAVSGYYQLVTKPSSGNNPSVTMVFATLAAPPTGSYNVINVPPATGQCQFNFTDASGNSGSPMAGSVSVTTGSPNVCTFSNLVCTCGATTYTLSGTFNY